MRRGSCAIGDLLVLDTAAVGSIEALATFAASPTKRDCVCGISRICGFFFLLVFVLPENALKGRQPFRLGSIGSMVGSTKSCGNIFVTGMLS